MRALVADLSLPRAAFTAVATTLRRREAPWGRGGVLSLQDVPVPALPTGDGWVRLRPTSSGVCGSDLKLLSVTGFSPVLTAFNAGERAVPGHEVVGVVEAAGPGVVGVAEGDRVVVEPTLHCRHKGLPPCARCQAGQGHLCENLAAAGDLCAGQGVGFSTRLGGGWSEAVVAHESMLTPVGDVSDDRAVLAEPASVALHAALRWQRDGDRVVVIGPGTIGLLVTAALRRLHPDLDITMVCAGEFGAERAVAAGATRTVQQPAANVLAEVAAQVGARLQKPRIGQAAGARRRGGRGLRLRGRPRHGGPVACGCCAGAAPT